MQVKNFAMDSVPVLGIPRTITRGRLLIDVPLEAFRGDVGDDNGEIGARFDRGRGLTSGDS